jgi:hypothetical protein
MRNMADSKNKKTPILTKGVPLFNYKAYSAATCLVSLLFKFAALLEWIILRLANLSIILTTLGNKVSAAFLSSSVRNLLIALRVVLCWYLLRNLTASFLLILFNADL